MVIYENVFTGLVRKYEGNVGYTWNKVKEKLDINNQPRALTENLSYYTKSQEEK